MYCLGATNRGTRYEGNVVGHILEFCRGLNAHGFSDFKRCTERMRGPSHLVMRSMILEDSTWGQLLKFGI